MEHTRMGRPWSGGGYSYRRELGLAELLPAAGIGLVVGLVAFYTARLLLQRTPLTPNAERAPSRPRRAPHRESMAGPSHA